MARTSASWDASARTSVRRSSNEISWDASDAGKVARADLEDKYGRKTPKQLKAKLLEVKDDITKYTTELASSTLRPDRVRLTDKIEKRHFAMAYLEEKLQGTGYEVEPEPAGRPLGKTASATSPNQEDADKLPQSSGDQSGSHRAAPGLPP